jgi:hypothetical protein
MQIDNKKSHFYFFEHCLGIVPIIAIFAQRGEAFFVTKSIIKKDMLEKLYRLLLRLKQ